MISIIICEEEKILNMNDVIVEMDEGVEMKMSTITKTYITREKVKGIENKNEKKGKR